MSNVSKIRKEYTHFRILVIGRANAGKTTLLKRVCNTTEDPCIYDEKKQNLLEPTDGRGIHDIHRPFGFKSNPEFIFHDSPGFEAGGEDELNKALSFITERAKATEVKDQLHAIWFCFIPDFSRPLLELEQKFFNEARAGNVPVIAVYTKFDDFIVQFYDREKEWEENYQAAESELKERFEMPLSRFNFPPKAHVRVEDLNDDESDHQSQVKELMTKTADSLDDPALQLLFVSVQQNNLELCITYAVKYLPKLSRLRTMYEVVYECVQWFRHAYRPKYVYNKSEIESIQEQRIDQQLFELGLLSLLPPQLSKNSKEVTAFLDTKSNKPSYILAAAILICTENTFWYKADRDTFPEAFEQVYNSYVGSVTEAEVESAIGALGGWYKDKDKQKRATSIILAHLLPHPDPNQE